jgi:hypothetical protein
LGLKTNNVVFYQKKKSGSKTGKASGASKTATAPQRAQLLPNKQFMKKEHPY